MEVLVLDGKNYVKASKAARNLGYATDYVGQLCRSGKMDAHLIGRTWYVNEEMLGTHKVEKKRISRVKAREYAKKTIEEHRVKINQEKNISKNIEIRYESDSEDLIPKTKKLRVESIPVVDPKLVHNEEYEGENEVVNKGDKVLMSGDLEVVDVTDGPLDTDTVVLTPGRIRKSPRVITEKEEKIAPVVEDEVESDLVEDNSLTSSDSEEEALAEATSTESEVSFARPITFTERLQRLDEAEHTENVAVDRDVVVEDARTEQISHNQPLEIDRSLLREPVNKPSLVPYLFAAVLIVIISFLSLSLSFGIEYTSGNPDKSHNKFVFAPMKAMYLLKTSIEERM